MQDVAHDYLRLYRPAATPTAATPTPTPAPSMECA
jgi:hypothetical protein